MFCVIAQNVPFEGYSQHGHFDSRPAKIHLGHICKSSRQELQQYVLNHRNEVAYNYKQTSLTDPMHYILIGCFCCIPFIFHKTSYCSVSSSSFFALRYLRIAQISQATRMIATTASTA